MAPAKQNENENGNEEQNGKGIEHVEQKEDGNASQKENEKPREQIRPVTPVRERRTSDRPRKIARLPSLKEISQNKKQQDAEKRKESDEPQEIYGEDPFTAEELKKAWDEFAASKKKEGKDIEHAILKQDHYLKDEHTIVLQLTNSVKIPILDKFRADLITHLKSTLNNRYIQLETELLEEEQAYRPYTNKEKFEYLAEKKPLLKELQERLGLDPDM